MIEKIDILLGRYGVDLGCVALLIVAAIFARGLPFLMVEMLK